MNFFTSEIHFYFFSYKNQKTAQQIYWMNWISLMILFKILNTAQIHSIKLKGFHPKPFEQKASNITHFSMIFITLKIVFFLRCVI